MNSVVLWLAGKVIFGTMPNDMLQIPSTLCFVLFSLFLLRYVVGNYLDLRKDANSQLSKNQASKHIIVVRSFLSIERVFLFFLKYNLLY